MKFLLLFVWATYLFSSSMQDAYVKLNTHATIKTVEEVQSMLEVMSADQGFQTLDDLGRVVVFQGTQRSYSDLFYKTIEKSVVDIMKKKDLKILFHKRQPIVKIVATPESFTIKKPLKEDIHKYARKMGASHAFLWDVFEFESNIYLVSQIVSVETNEIVWYFKTDVSQLEKRKKLEEDIQEYVVVDNSYISVGFGTHYLLSKLERTPTVTAASSGVNAQTTQSMVGLDIGYSTQSMFSQKLRFGLLFQSSTAIASTLNISLNHYLFDIRYQLDPVAAPLVDPNTGKVILERNKQALMFGFAFGPGTATAEKSSAFNVISPYLNVGISKRLEFNMGATAYIKGTLEFNDDTNFQKASIPLDSTSIFFNIRYRFHFHEDSL